MNGSGNHCLPLTLSVNPRIRDASKPAGYNFDFEHDFRWLEMFISGREPAEISLKDAATVWARMSRLFSLCANFPEIHDSEPDFQAAVAEFADDRYLALHSDNGALVLRHKYFNDHGDIHDFASDPPWGEVARFQGNPDPAQSKLQKGLMLSNSGITDYTQIKADFPGLLLGQKGCISLLLKDDDENGEGSYKQVVQLKAWWLEPEMSVLKNRMPALQSDVQNHINRISPDVADVMDASPYGTFLPREWAERNFSHPGKFSPKPLKFPEGATNCRRIDGVIHFTSDDELGVPADYYMDKFGNWRPDADRSIIIMHYGQSNASINAGGGAIEAALRCPFHVVNLNDGQGARGHMGLTPRRSATGFVPCEQDLQISIQSAVAVAGGVYIEEQLFRGAPPVQVIVRSEAKGGQPFIGKIAKENMPGIHKYDTGEYSPAFRNVLRSLRESVEFASRDGAPASHIYIPFTHQEANQGNPPEVYVAQAMDMFRDVERELTDLDVPITWILDQASGTSSEFAGGAWPARLALEMLSDQADNIHFLQPRYAYPMFDTAHWSNIGKVMYGELLGHAIADLEAGKPMRAARLKASRRDGETIILTFDSMSPLTFDEENHPVLDSVKGFTITGDPGLEITDARMTGARDLAVTLNREPIPGRNVRLCYAYRRSFDRAKSNGWPYSNGALRETWQVPCRAFIDVMIHRWVPAFVTKI